MRSRLTSFCALAISVLLLPAPSFSMDTPLSEEAVRDAYFLGQRHGKDLDELLAKYLQPLPPPDSGPYIASVTFYTPYALVAQVSSQRTMNYSAQQAEQDHRGQEELVRVIIQIQLTPTYPALLSTPTGSRSGSPIGYTHRPSDFWKDFDVQAFDKDKSILPLSSTGNPLFSCDSDGGCLLSGATVQLDFLAKSFKSDNPTIQITPPEGDPVAVEFDLTRLR